MKNLYDNFIWFLLVIIVKDIVGIVNILVLSYSEEFFEYLIYILKFSF